jgi:hypothetical protein
MVGTAGAGRGRSVEGSLQLRPRAAGDIRRSAVGGTFDLSATQPYVGRAAIELAAVGAMTEGTVESDSALAPGAMIVAYPGDPRGVRLSLGSGVNRFEFLILDGSNTEFRILRIGPDGFSGRWRATFSYTTYRSEGHFCAIRAGR